MAHVGWHIASAVPFVVAGQYEIAVGCLLPDLSWLRNEVAIQINKPTRPLDTIEGFTDEEVLPYRIFHSVLFWGAAAAVGLFSWKIVLGVLIHLALDQPTHTGKMQQMPLFPFRWRWPWTLKG